MANIWQKAKNKLKQKYQENKQTRQIENQKKQDLKREVKAAYEEEYKKGAIEEAKTRGYQEGKTPKQPLHKRLITNFSNNIRQETPPPKTKRTYSNQSEHLDRFNNIFNTGATDSTLDNLANITSPANNNYMDNLVNLTMPNNTQPQQTPKNNNHHKNHTRTGQQTPPRHTDINDIINTDYLGLSPNTTQQNKKKKRKHPDITDLF